jgi:hypothetical protein
MIVKEFGKIGNLDITTSFLDQNITQGSVYSYRITAFNSAGFSDFSNSATIKIDGKTYGKRK